MIVETAQDVVPGETTAEQLERVKKLYVKSCTLTGDCQLMYLQTKGRE